ncbi:MAG: hypothetical protein Q8Q60_05140 [Candidatus Chromulinivorax sp.]|nr:hypothetical protein [Candidatus Chromulinivorax sp.]
MKRKLLMRAFFSISLLDIYFQFQLQAIPNATPTVSRVYGDYFIDGVAQEPLLGSPGALDTTFGLTGSLDCNNQLAGGQVRAIQVLPNGTIIAGLSLSGSDSFLASYNYAGIINTSSFGNLGLVNLGSATLAMQTMFIDAQNRILVAGGNDAISGTAGWLKRVSSNGGTVASYTGGIWRFIGALAQQTTGDIIAVGFDNNNAQIARYTVGTSTTAGQLDTTFGSSGIISLNGSGGLPTSTNGLYNVVVDSNNLMYVAYLDTSNTVNIIRFTSSGNIDTTFGTGGIAPISYLAGATADQLRMALDGNNNLVIAAQVGTSLKVATILSSTGGTNSSFTNCTITSSGNILDLRSLLTTTDDSVVLIGSNETTKMSRVTRITGAGVLDTAFNGTGYNEFSIGSPTTNSYLLSATISGDGRLYVAGSQTSSDVTIPYISSMYYDAYTSQVNQFPAAQEQGIQDITFGSLQTYPGVISPFDGLYGVMLMQRARSVVELASGNLLVGMDGHLSTSSNSNMIVTRLTSAGLFDTTFASGAGKVALASHQTNEYLTSIAEDTSTNIYVTGYSTSGAILRQYNNQGVEQWVGDINTAEYQGLGVAIQGSDRALLCTQVTATTGQLSAHSLTSGAIDTTFHASGTTPGVVLSTDFGLNMGPIFNSIINSEDVIFIAYKNSSTGSIDVAALSSNGSELISQFGNNGVVSNIFSSATIAANNIRIAFDHNYNIIVAASTGTGLIICRLDGAIGIVDATFNSAGSAPGFLTIPSVGTSLALQKVTGASDGSVVLTGYDVAIDDTMLVIRISPTGLLDTTFNSQGVTPGILFMKIGNRSAVYNSRVATDLAIQSDTGNLVVTGYEQMTSNDSMPVVMRLFGQSGTTEIKASAASNQSPGTLDKTFNKKGAMSLNSLIASGSAKVIYSYRSTDVNQGKLLIGIDTGSSIKIARVNALTMVLDTTFATAGILTVSSLTGINHISVDAHSKIMIAGTASGAGWMRRLTVAGAIDVAATMPSNIAAINHIYQQKSGRYIGACNDISGNGVLVAWQDKLVGSYTALSVDTTFNPLGSMPGQFVIGSTGAYNLAINSDDTILVAYASTTVKVSKIQANGAGLVASFGVSGILNTTITPKNSSEMRVAIDSNNKIIVAASTGSTGTGMSVVRYLATGAIDTTFNATGAIKTISNLGTAGITLTHCMVTNETSGNDKIIVLGYNSSGGNGKLFAVRLSAAGALDSTWNPSPKSPDTAGVLTYTVNNSTNVYSGTIAVNGSVYCCGLGTTNVPLVIRIVGDSYITESEQQPFEAAAGIVDTTLDSSGALNLNTALSATLGAPQKIYTYTSGAMLMTSNLSSSTYLTKFTAAGTLDTTFNSTGIVTIANAASVNDMYVANGPNDDGSIYLAGMNNSTPWAAKISTAGVVTSFALPNSLSMLSVNGIRKTSNGRILLAGQTTSSGVVVAYNATGSAVDVSFGNGLGYYATGVTTDLYNMALDSSDRIYIAYKDTASSTIKVKRILSNGGGVDATFTTGSITQTNALSASQIDIALDATNQQLVVVVQDGTTAGNILKVARFNAATGSSTGAISTITVPSNILNLSNVFIDSSQNIYVIGYNATANYSVVARVASTSSTTIALDSTYATASTPAGIANIATGAMTTVAAGTLGLDRRIYLVGNNGSSVPYLARIFGDAYTTQVFELLPQAIPGVIDLTLDPNDIIVDGGIVLSGLVNWPTLVGYTARSVQANNDGSCYIAFGNGINLIVGKVDADMNPITSFGTDGLTSVQPMATVNSLAVDAAGKILVAGTQLDVQKVIRFTTSGVIDLAFATTLSSKVGTTIVEQKSGRLLVGGLIDSTGVINAYQNTGDAHDASFGPASLLGYFATNINAQVDDIAVDGNDYIYFAYRNSSNHACVGKLTANGSGLVSEFSGGAIIDTGVTASATQPVRIAINNAGNVLVAITTTTLVQTILYNGTTGAVISSAQTILSTNSPIVTKLVGVGVDFIGSAYTTATAMIAFRIVGSTGLLDTGFGILNNGLGSFNPSSATAMHSITVQPDGRIVMVGTNGIAPVLMRVYGSPYISQYAQMPGRATAGTLDATLSPLTGGTLIPATVSLSEYAIKRLHAYNNGNMLLVCDNGVNTVVLRLLKDLTLDTAGFNSPNGFVALPDNANIRGLYVNSSGTIFVSGGSAPGWVAAYTNSGVVASGWTTPVNNLSQGAYQIGQQTSTRLISAGLGASAGTLYGYTPTGILDTEFGIGGVVTTGVAAPIAGMSINSLDQIIIAYSNSGTSVLQKISSDGATITTLNSGTAITGINRSEDVRVVHDTSGNIIVAAATTSGFRARRYTSSGANSPSAAITIAAGGSGTSHLGNIYTTSDGKTVLVGYETTSNNIIVTRFDANFVLDSTFNNGAPLITPMSSMNLAYDACIHIDDRVMIAGGNSSSSNPSLARVFGDNYVTYTSQGPSLGIAGTIDTTFATSGAFTISSLGAGALNSTQGKSIVSLSDGGSYIALNNGTSSSKLIRLTAENSLYTTFGTNGIATDTLQGVNFMMLTGNNNVLLVGTTNAGIGWVSRYKNDNSGLLDTTFNSSGSVSFGSSTTANIAVEQTLGRIIVAGQDSSGRGILRAYTNFGAVDVTFNPNSMPGSYNTGISTEIYALAADQFDRLIIAYKNNSNIDIARLTPSGDLDTSFGVGGIISGAIANADQVAQVRLVLNTAGNIVVAAHITASSVQKIAVKSYNNGIALSGNGAVVNAEFDITGLTSPTLTDFIATLDGDVIAIGTQSESNPMWAARLLLSGTAAITLDTAFNPIGAIPGIMTYSGAGTSTHTYSACAVRPDGRLLFVGGEDVNPTLIRAYNNPYIVEGIQSPNAKPIGTNDTTFGLTGTNGITFFGSAGTSSSQGQVAQAIGLQDDNNIMIALDGQISGSTDNYMFLNMFDVDGLLNSGFGTAGKVQLPHNYQYEHVKDMFTYTTATGINKAIIVGYATNAILNVSGSLVMQYNVSSQVADTSFGGLNGNPTGVAFGDGFQANVIGRQTMGRIIVSGTGLNGDDVLLGYTPTGSLDQSFGLGGYMTRGTNPIYTHVIDSMNRIVIAYNDGTNKVAVARILANGSGLDTTFGTNGLVTSVISGISGNSNMRVAIDGNGKIIVVAVNSSGTNYVINRYLSTGALDVSLTITSANLGTVTNITLSKLLVGIDGKVTIVGYDANAIQNKIMIVRTTTTLSGMDTTFNASQTPGYITYEVASGVTQTANDAIIHPDGRIIVVGSEN